MPDTQNTNTTQTAPPGLVNMAPGSTTTTPGTPAPGATPGAPVTAYTPAQSEASTYKPSAFNVAPEATVAGQVKSLLDAGSPLLEQAESKARDQMNARGLINSSMGITAGQSAVIGAALPIAQADAATYDRAATNTANAENQAGQFNSGIETQNSQFNAGQENAALNAAATASNQQSLTAQQIAGQKGIAELQAQTTTGTAQLAADTQKQIAQLQADTSLSAEDRRNATQTAIANMQSSTQLSLADKNDATQKALAQIQQDTSLSVTDKNNIAQKAIADLQIATQKELKSQELNNQLTLQERAAQANQALANLQATTQQAITKMQTDASMTIAEKQAETQKWITLQNTGNAKEIQAMVNAGNLANIQANGTINKELTELQDRNKLLLQTSSGASQVYSQALQSFTNIINNPEYGADVKKAHLETEMSILDSTLSNLGQIANVPGLQSNLEFHQV